MTLLERLIAEREPALDKMTRERDCVEDEAFYTGLGWALEQQIQRELDQHMRVPR